MIRLSNDDGCHAIQDGNLACIVLIDRIIVVIYLIRKSGPNLNRQLYANGTSFLLKIKKKSAQVISFTANVFEVFKLVFFLLRLTTANAFTVPKKSVFVVYKITLSALTNNFSI